jgi:phosphate transport system substrate-binding protein
VDFPIYEEVGSALEAQGINLDYQLLAPGAALSEFRAGRTAFVASDGPGSDPSLPRRAGTRAEHVPVALWGVAVIYNLPRLHARLRLDGATLADMYRGVIKDWNSPEIARENPGVKLPSIPIRVVHRADATAATALLTRYMAGASMRWRRAVGSGSAVRWPGGTADAGDDELVATVGQNPGAIGYTEASVALLNGVPAAALRNAAGRFVAPTATEVREGAYPLVAQAYLLAYRDLCGGGLTPSQASAMRAFVTYLLGPGQAVVRRLWFAPLPGGLLARAREQAARLVCG